MSFVAAEEEWDQASMLDRIAESTDQIDAKTSKAVAEAIGARLRTDTRPEESKLPSRLQHLMDRLRAQEQNT